MHDVNNVRFHAPYRLLFIALAYGVIADLLLRATPWGLNVLLAVVCALAAAALLTHWSHVRLEGEGRWLVPAIVFFAVGLVWRDSPTLTTANALALALSITLAALSARAGQLRLAGITQYLLGVLYVVLFAFAGLLPTLTRELSWRSMGSSAWRRPALAASRGVVLAVPPLLVFSGLFAAADANYQHLLDELFDVDPSQWIVHGVLILAYAWLCGGVLREMLLAPSRPRTWTAPPRRLHLGGVELAMVLALVDVLFLTFVVLQLPYLFGGRAQVSSIGFSEYARRGFFELVWVAGLSLPLLLGVHWLVGNESPRARRAFTILAAIMVGLLFVIEASAAQRMQIYVADAGLTELRLQASAAMVWLCVVLAWFVVTVLRGQRKRFAFGALVSGLVLIAALDVVSPDALIVRTNAAFGHLLDDGHLDARPLASLSADAAPALVEALPLLPQPQRDEVEARLLSKYGVDDADWRSFNLSRWQAARAVATLR
jgi:hypothetical protein